MTLTHLRLLPALALLIACGGDLPDERHDDLTHADMEPDQRADMAEDTSADSWFDMFEEPDAAPDIEPPVYELPELEPISRPDYPLDDALRFDQLTMRCTHNSYHVAPSRPLFQEHDYSHVPLIEQAEAQGVRAFELDVQPLPGLPVQHIPGIDPATTCDTLHRCLSEIAHWSDARPGHHMLVIWIEIKDEIGARKFSDYDALDATIRSVFPPEKLYTPDDLLRGHATVRDSLRALGWPTLGQTRDRVMFAMINSGTRHKQDYLREDNSLTGRILHLRTRVEEVDEPWAAVAKIDDPLDAESIQIVRDAGLLVASNVGAAKYDDATNIIRRQAGLDNGVHMRCDDFPAQGPTHTTWLEYGDGAPTSCNPVSADERCSARDVEALDVHNIP